jgi:hypothetical protein
MTTRKVRWEGSAYMQDIVSHIREALPELEKVCDTMFPVTLYQKNIMMLRALMYSYKVQAVQLHCSQQTADI